MRADVEDKWIFLYKPTLRLRSIRAIWLDKKGKLSPSKMHFFLPVLFPGKKNCKVQALMGQLPNVICFQPSVFWVSWLDRLHQS